MTAASGSTGHAHRPRVTVLIQLMVKVVTVVVAMLVASAMVTLVVVVMTPLQQQLKWSTHHSAPATRLGFHRAQAPALHTCQV